jgi:hypothetical protein
MCAAAANNVATTPNTIHDNLDIAHGNHEGVMPALA